MQRSARELTTLYPLPLLHPNPLHLFSFSLSFLSPAFLCTLPSVSFLSPLSSPSIIRTSHKPSEELDTGLSRRSLNVLQWQLGRREWKVGNPLAARRRKGHGLILFSILLGPVLQIRSADKPNIGDQEPHGINIVDGTITFYFFLITPFSLPVQSLNKFF